MWKRIFDIAVSLAGLVLLAPLLFAVAVCVKLDSQGPVFFRQARVGRRGRLFSIHKFRTMRMGSESAGQLTLAQDSRVTRCGRVLRRYHLDELPQLIDVLAGSMSIVGPRPEVPRFVERYSPADRKAVLSVRPGMTDHASLFFRNEATLLAGASDPDQEYFEGILPLKLEMQRQYVEHRTFWSDLRIIGRTLWVILSQRR